MITLAVDFNDLAGGEDQLFADIPAKPLWLGERVKARDFDGNTVEADVIDVDRQADIVVLRPVWDTWLDASDAARSSDDESIVGSRGEHDSYWQGTSAIRSTRSVCLIGLGFDVEIRQSTARAEFDLVLLPAFHSSTNWLGNYGCAAPSNVIRTPASPA